MTLAKICGIRRVSEAIAALEAGADMLGFVFAPSQRCVSPDAAAEIIAYCHDSAFVEHRQWHAVGVFADQPLSHVLETARHSKLDVVQLSGREPPEYWRQLSLPIFKAFHLPGRDALDSVGAAYPQSLGQLVEAVKAASGVRILLDSGRRGEWGGTGRSFEWSAVGEAARECIVAGGLNPTNVAAAIECLNPWAVDVSSGVETDGRKDPWLIRRFVSEVRRCDQYGSQSDRRRNDY